MLHRPGKFLRRQSIQHVFSRQPRPPRLGNAVMDFLQSSYEAAAELAGWDRAALER